MYAAEECWVEVGVSRLRLGLGELHSLNGSDLYRHQAALGDEPTEIQWTKGL